jgi:hypothetical protein
MDYKGPNHSLIGGSCLEKHIRLQTFFLLWSKWVHQMGKRSNISLWFCFRCDASLSFFLIRLFDMTIWQSRLLGRGEKAASLHGRVSHRPRIGVVPFDWSIQSPDKERGQAANNSDRLAPKVESTLGAGFSKPISRFQSRNWSRETN